MKELPVLGPGSLDAARVAVAVHMQDPGGQKYIAFHQELLGGPGPASREKALAAAKDQASTWREVGATFKEDVQLASTVGITGTPGYVIGKDVILGAVEVTGLKQQIERARESAH